jgi:ATP-binding cassette subfamily B protein
MAQQRISMSNGMIRARHLFGRDASVTKIKVRPGTTKRILRFAVPYKWLLAFFLVLVVVGAGISVINPLLYRDIINEGVLKTNAGLVGRLAVLVAALSVADAGLGLLQAYLAARIGSEIVLSMRTKLFDHIQRMPLAFFTRVQTGALVSRLNNDVTGAQNAFTDVLSEVVGNLISVVLVVGAMFLLSWQITLASMVLLPLFIWPARFFGRKLHEITRESYDLTAAMNSLMIERFNVAGAQLAKIFGRREREASAFRTRAQRVSAIGVKRALYGRFFFSALMLTSATATALVYGWGGMLAIRGVLDVGTLVAFVAYLYRLYRPLSGLSNIHVSIMTALVSFERVFEVLDLIPAIRDEPDALEIPRGPATITFSHVSFRYPTAAEVSLASLESVAVPEKTRERTILHDIDFTVKPGQLVALVGPSGGGKTTITQLIVRFYDPQSGSVRLDGIDLRQARLESVHERVGVVAQEACLFHDTIRANLLYAQPDATETQLREVLDAAQILRLIDSLPQGLDTLVGERGYRFSGGEKQRLAIARLLLKAPEIIILDEATAHLDSESEAAIQKALEVALAGRTSVVIAHRLSTILHADQILVVNQGRIVERGTHPQLLEEGGLYADLYRRQFARVQAPIGSDPDS